MTIDGKKYDCTFDNAKMLYARFPWIKEQVDRYVGDRSNFLSVS